MQFAVIRKKSNPAQISRKMTSLLKFLDRQPKTWLWCETIALALFVGYLDYVTGYEVSIILLYAIPIVLMVWFNDKSSAIFIAILCSIIWWWADEAAGHIYLEGWHHIWQTGEGLAFFLLFVQAGHALKTHAALWKHSRQLEQAIICISEQEQQRIGRDLHDGICQYFAAIGCAAGALRHNLEKHCAAQARDAGEIEDLVMKGVEQTRNLARGLFPVESDESGLQSALQTLAASASRLLNLKCSFETDGGPVPVFDNDCATHLYRIAQESISNAKRHGRADAALIRLSQDDARISLSVSDNGVGIGPQLAEGTGMGLGIMRYRAHLIGGDFAIAARPEGGTLVTCSFLQPP
jgi:signal transduction histidine kinase